MFIRPRAKHRGDAAEPAHHLVEHLGGEVEDEIELVRVTLPGKQHPVLRPDPVFAGDKGQIRQNAEFDRAHIARFLCPEAIVIGRNRRQGLGRIWH